MKYYFVNIHVFTFSNIKRMLFCKVLAKCHRGAKTRQSAAIFQRVIIN